MNLKKIFAVTCVIAVMSMILSGCGKDGSIKDFDYNSLNFKEYLTLGNYKGLELSVPEITISEEDVNRQIESTLEGASKQKTIKEGAVAKGDKVNIDFDGTIDGKAFKGGSAKNFEMVLGDTPMIEGFAEGIMGHNIGEEIELDLTFPKDYHEKSVAGKPVRFKIHINSKKVSEKPELTDAWAKENVGADSVEAFKTQVRAQLEEQAKAQADQSTRENLWNQVSSTSKVKKRPEEAVEIEYNRILETYKSIAKKNYKMTLDEYLKKYANQSKKDFEKQSKKNAERVVEDKLILNAIAKKENIKVTDKEFEKQLDETLKQAGLDKKKFEKEYEITIEGYAEKFDWRSSMLFDKVLERIQKLGKKK